MISIIIPVYQVEKYLRKCLDSVIAQTFSDLEIILIDDGSTDSSGEICNEYATKDSRIKVIHQENQGLSASRNVGLDIARGDFIGFVDSDDYIEPAMFENLYQAALKNNADIVICNFIKADDVGKNLICSDFGNQTEDSKDFVKKDGIRYNYVWHKLYRKHLFKTIRFPEDKLWEDLFVMHNIFWTAKKITFIPYIGYNYLQHTQSISSKRLCETHLDYCDGIIARLKFLNDVCASPKAIHHWIMSLYTTREEYRKAGALKNHTIRKRWKNIHNEFRKIFFKIQKRDFSLNRILQYALIFIHPNLYSHAIPIRIFLQEIQTRLWWKKLYYKSTTIEFTKDIKKIEYKKYFQYWKKDKNKDIIQIQAKTFFKDKIDCIQESQHFSEDPCKPIVIVVEKNELKRMQLFYSHYRKQGIHQFIVIDNGSTDGTLDFLKQQHDTKIYQTLENYQTHKRDAWIQRILVQNGYNKWYIVVDSDELLDYIGSEKYSIEYLIRKMHHAGYRRLWGFMLDMYSRENLFCTHCNAIDIPQKFNYFDKNSYFFKHVCNENGNKSNAILCGGPRHRLFGVSATQSKQSIFYFDKNILYANSHFLFPQIPWGEVPCCFVLRHYKFLPQDKNEYDHRIKNKNFYKNSVEYKNIMMQIEQKKASRSLYYEDSVFYENSDSLRCLPFLEAVL